MIPSEIQKIEMKLDRKLLEERKDIECQLRTKLNEMRPRVKFPRNLLCKLVQSNINLGINRSEGYDQKWGEKSNEVANQKQREADKFAYYYERNTANRNNPNKELDELYSKDDKVPCIDLVMYAEEHQKSMEDKLFNEEMEQLQPELDKLEEGKYSTTL